MKLSPKKIGSFFIQIIIFAIIAYGIGKWQSRNMIEEDLFAPDFNLTSLENINYKLSDYKGKKVVVYFFSPFCTVCKISSHNLVTIKEKNKEKNIVVLSIALSWDSIDEVKNFSKSHNFNFPVLLGDRAIGSKFKISAYPSIYIINEEGQIKDRLIGYTTEIGLKLRLLFN